MVVEYIRYRIASEAAGEFEEAYRRASSSLDGSEHCRRYELARGVEEPDRYILRIEWDSLEGHLQGFRSSPQFRDFFEPVRPYVGHIEEMHHYERTPVASRQAPS